MFRRVWSPAGDRLRIGRIAGSTCVLLIRRLRIAWLTATCDRGGSFTQVGKRLEALEASAVTGTALRTTGFGRDFSERPPQPVVAIQDGPPPKTTWATSNRPSEGPGGSARHWTNRPQAVSPVIRQLPVATWLPPESLRNRNAELRCGRNPPNGPADPLTCWTERASRPVPTATAFCL